MFAVASSDGKGNNTNNNNSTPSTFAFSALPHLAEDLTEQMHPESLAPRPLTVVSLDHRLMGAGGDDSWSACVHDEFLIMPGQFKFGFAVAPYWRAGGGAVGEGDAAAECWRGLRGMVDG